MSWTKRQIITQAFEEIGLAQYIFDLPPEELRSALDRLNALMAAWNAKGIRLGYPIPGTYDTDSLDADSNLPDSAFEAVYTNLAIRLAPKFGKVVSVDTKMVAHAAYNTLMAIAAYPPEKAFPTTLPRGSGSKPWRYVNPFIRAPEVTILDGPDGEIELI